MEPILLNNALKLYVCESFLDELKAVTQKYENITVSPYRAKCKYQSIDDPFADIELGDDTLVLGACSVEKAMLAEIYDVSREQHCFFMIAPKSLVESYITKGAYIITSGWLKHWEHYVKEYWEFNQEYARLFFRDSCKNLIFLDTGIYGDMSRELEEFSAFVQRPYERVDIGLEFFQLYIDNIILSRESEQRVASLQSKYEESYKKVADYALAFNLLGQLDVKKSEQKLIAQIKEIFLMLFAPQTVIYFAISKDKILEELSDKSEEFDPTLFLQATDDYEICSDGFRIKLLYHGKIYGIVYAQNIALVQYIPQYLNLAINISGLCALTINNTRKALKTKELEAQLMQQSKLAAMGEMMGSVAHQWRQPLNEININIEMLEEYYELDEIDEEFIEEFIEKNTKTIQFLSKTISDFSDFFRVNKQKTHFSLKTCIDNTISLIQARLTKHAISLEILGEDVTLFGLSNELQQVILNIFNNAIDAIIQNSIKDGKITIEMKEESNQIVVIIEDNGLGVPDDIIERVFEPYFTTKEQGKGIGMGLYISKMIIESNLGGELSVCNHKDGAQFTIKLKSDDR